MFFLLSHTGGNFGESHLFSDLVNLGQRVVEAFSSFWSTISTTKVSELNLWTSVLNDILQNSSFANSDLAIFLDSSLVDFVFSEAGLVTITGIVILVFIADAIA